MYRYPYAIASAYPPRKHTKGQSDQRGHASRTRPCQASTSASIAAPAAKRAIVTPAGSSSPRLTTRRVITLLAAKHVITMNTRTRVIGFAMGTHRPSLARGTVNRSPPFPGGHRKDHAGARQRNAEFAPVHLR